ncbi:hypothetical protein [Rhodovulum iodosum]|uniref:hypothetical protein n=1 Tax=Rhodovulum iodosum TaxID=68291 RepID=UPI001FE66A6F|nr:hypothetical protein [Rhodovulum robiginosum]
MARQGYRRRRLVDMALLLPLLGVVLFQLPLLAGGAETGPRASTIAYLFAAWALLIVMSALLARRLCQAGDPYEEEAGTGPGDGAP